MDYALPNAQREEIYLNEVIPRYFKNNCSQSFKPSIHLTAGQPGAGKTLLRSLIQENCLQEPQSSIIINTDDMREYHPRYYELLRNPKTVVNAPQIVNEDASYWVQRIFNDSIKQGREIVFDSTLGGNADALDQSFQLLKSKNYSIHIHILAVPAGVSKLGIYFRYASQLDSKNAGRIVSMKVHDKNYIAIPENLKYLATSPNAMVDDFSVYKKYIAWDRNKFLNKALTPLLEKVPCKNINAVIDCLLHERKRVFTTVEQSYYTNKVQDCINLVTKHQPTLLNQFTSDIEQLLKKLKMQPPSIS